MKDEDLGILTQLGLTPRQAEIYLTICKSKYATARTCAKKMQIARAEIYRLIPDLEELGLISRIITTPITFKATPLAEGLSILMKQNAEKLNEIQAKAKELVKNFKQNNIKEPSQEETQCVLIFENGHSRREFLKRMNNLQTSLDGIIRWALFRHDVLRYTVLFKKALERGAKLRHITHIPKGERIPEVFHILKTAGSFEVKYTSTPPPTTMAIFDKKVVSYIISKKGCMLGYNVLLSDNPLLVATCQDYFELKWQSATPC